MIRRAYVLDSLTDNDHMGPSSNTIVKNIQHLLSTLDVIKDVNLIPFPLKVKSSQEKTLMQIISCIIIMLGIQTEEFRRLWNSCATQYDSVPAGK